VSDGFYIRGNISIIGHGPTSKIKNYCADRGTSTTGGVLLYYQSETSSTHTFSGAVSGGDLTFTLNTVVGLSEGDDIFLQFGEAEYDASQPWLCMFNTIASISGNDVTLKVGVPEDIANGVAHKLLKFTKVVQNVKIANLSLEDAASSSPDQLVYIERCRNVKVENLYSPEHRGSIINAQSENVTIDGFYSTRAKYAGAYAASGNLIGGWGFRNFNVKNVFGMCVDHCGIYFEAHGRGAWLENIVIKQGSSGTGADYGFTVVGACKDIHLKNYHYHSDRSTSWATNIHQEGAEVTTENVSIYGKAGTLFPLEQHKGMLGWGNADGGNLTYYDRIKM